MTPEAAAAFVSRVEAGALRVETEMPTARLVWHRWGAGQNVVLLHGGAGSWRHWIRNIDELSHRFRLTVPDLPGLGESDLPPEPADARSIATILADWLDTALGPATPFHLVGFSFGGVVGAELALLRPADIRSLIIVGSSSLGLTLGPRRELVRVRHLVGAERRAAHVTNLSHQMIAEPARIDELAVMVQEWNVQHSRLNTPAISQQNSLRRALGELRVPLHAIYGDRDSVAYPFIQERIDLYRALQPGAVMHLVPGAGHWVQYEAAEEFNSLLEGSLA